MLAVALLLQIAVIASDDEQTARHIPRLQHASQNSIDAFQMGYRLSQ